MLIYNYACSCFLIAMESDSIEGIYDTLKTCALISKSAGGVGLHVHCIRAAGSFIAGVSLVCIWKLLNKRALSYRVTPQKCQPEKSRNEIVFDRLWYPLSILLLAAIVIGAKLIGTHVGLQTLSR